MAQHLAAAPERQSDDGWRAGDAATPGQLFNAARCGNDRAWAELVGRLDGLVHATARRFRLQDTDVDDVAQATWLRLYQHADNIENVDAVPGWLVKTAGRECLRLLTRRNWECLSLDGELPVSTEQDSGPEAEVLTHELHAAVRAAVEALPEKRRRLVWTLAGRTATYIELAHAMSMPQGSIGPTWNRSIGHVRMELQAQGFGGIA